jgi:hypothetical protein
MKIGLGMLLVDYTCTGSARVPKHSRCDRTVKYCTKVKQNWNCRHKATRLVSIGNPDRHVTSISELSGSLKGYPNKRPYYAAYGAVNYP